MNAPVATKPGGAGLAWLVLGITGVGAPLGGFGLVAALVAGLAFIRKRK